MRKVVNNYNIRTKLRFLTELNQTHSKLNPSFFKNPNRNQTKIKKFCTSLLVVFISLNNKIKWAVTTNMQVLLNIIKQSYHQTEKKSTTNITTVYISNICYIYSTKSGITAVHESSRSRYLQVHKTKHYKYNTL